MNGTCKGAAEHTNHNVSLVSPGADWTTLPNVSIRIKLQGRAPVYMRREGPSRSAKIDQAARYIYLRSHKYSLKRDQPICETQTNRVSSLVLARTGYCFRLTGITALFFFYLVERLLVKLIVHPFLYNKKPN